MAYMIGSCKYLFHLPAQTHQLYWKSKYVGNTIRARPKRLQEITLSGRVSNNPLEACTCKTLDLMRYMESRRRCLEKHSGFFSLR